VTEKRPPTRDEVLAWMRVTGKGYKLAAAHFQISASAIKGWVHRAKQKAIKAGDVIEAPERRPPAPVVRLVPPAAVGAERSAADMPLEDDALTAYERKLRELELDMTEAAPAKKAGLYGRWRELREHVDVIRRERSAALGLEDLPEDELRGRLEQLFRALPDAHLELAVRVWQERVGVVVLPTDVHATVN
jgi:hypothetical protein